MSKENIGENTTEKVTLNIYEKIQTAKKILSQENIRKSGLNTYSNFQYYELSDFMPSIIKIFDDLKLFSKVEFNNELAVLKIVNAEKPEEQEEYTSPMKDLEIKGANAMQILGGIETYQRRYLYMSALDITENDMFDPNSGNGENPSNERQRVDKSASSKKASSKQINLIYAILSDISKGYEVIGKKVAVEATIQQMKNTLRLNKDLQEFTIADAGAAIDYLTNIKINIPKPDKTA